MKPVIMHQRIAPWLVLPFLLGCETRARVDGEFSVTTRKDVAVDEGCPHMKDGSCDHASSEAKAGTETPPGPRLYGEPLGKSPRVSLASVLENPERYNQKTVRVDGHVRRACSRKGCWMELATDDKANSPSCRVTFKDYGFLVPTDSAGSDAKLEGVVQVTEVKKEAVDHYESEGAHFPGKRPDGTALEVRLVATGVELEKS